MVMDERFPLTLESTLAWAKCVLMPHCQSNTGSAEDVMTVVQSLGGAHCRCCGFTFAGKWSQKSMWRHDGNGGQSLKNLNELKKAVDQFHCYPIILASLEDCARQSVLDPLSYSGEKKNNPLSGRRLCKRPVFLQFSCIFPNSPPS